MKRAAIAKNSQEIERAKLDPNELKEQARERETNCDKMKINRCLKR